MKQDEPQHKPQSLLEALLHLERKQSAPAGGVPRLKQEVPSPAELRRRQKVRRRLRALQKVKEARHALPSHRAKERWHGVRRAFLWPTRRWSRRWTPAD